MASVWIRTRTTKDGKTRYLVGYRIGGRETSAQHAGSFRTRRLAVIRAGWIEAELAAGRVPNLRRIEAETPKLPTLEEAAARWRDSRIDVDRQTANMHRSAFVRIFKLAPDLRGRPVDELTVDDATGLVAALAAARYKRETIRKTRTVLAQCLDHYAVDPNPARDERVKLPKERKAHIPPPLAEHVERVADTVAAEYVLPILVIDECGPRVSELETAQVGDVDEHRKAIRVRWTFEKNERYRHLELPDDLFAALLATMPPREDRDLEAPLFPDLTDGRLRMAITRACKATGTPHFSPHGLRRRRGSLHYKRTRLSRRGSRAPRRLKAGRRRPLRLRAHRLPRGRQNDCARPNADVVLTYHRTYSATVILRDGFQDGEPGKEVGEMEPGVWVSAERPLTADEWERGGDVIEVDIPERLFAEYEWINVGVAYREALIPAAELNKYPRRRLGEGA
jgi:integrase